MKIGNIHFVDLRKEIEKIISFAPQIDGIYIFGSRAFKTDSRSSDIDLLIVSKVKTSLSANEEYVGNVKNPLDIFETTSITSRAKSIKTGGSIDDNSPKNLVKKLKAILLWDGSSREFTKDIDDFRSIEVYNDSIFLGSVIPEMSNIISNLKYIDNYCLEHNIQNTFLGCNEKEILNKIASIIKIPFEKTFLTYFIGEGKARSFNKKRISIESEYDFQNLIYFILRPWIPNIKILKNSDAIINIDGNDKVADLSFNNFLIEAKYISDTNAKDSIMKALHGLQVFYDQNPKVRGILFPILYEENIEIGESEIANLIDNERTKLFLIPNRLNNFQKNRK